MPKLNDITQVIFSDFKKPEIIRQLFSQRVVTVKSQKNIDFFLCHMLQILYWRILE